MKKERIQLSDHFNYVRLLRFVFPSIVMMIFTSIYGVVDGLFVSNFAGKSAFAAVNFIYPLIMILCTGGFMLGTGGSAYVSKLLGELRNEKANRIFSMILMVTLILGVSITLLGEIFLRKITMLMGAEGELLENSILYGRIMIMGVTAFMYQMEFQSLFATAEKPNLGLVFTVASGVANIILDFLFVGIFQWGLIGASSASVISQMIGGFGPLVYFALPNTSLFRLTRPVADFRALFKICTNGCSELMSNISMSLVSMLYNIQLLFYAGENGIAAYGVLMYVNMIFLSAFIGYSMGSAPIIGYNYGAKNRSELRGVLKKSLIIIFVFSISMLLLSLALSRPLSTVFTGYDRELLEMTVRGFYIFSFSFLFAGFAIFGSSFFTALNNGLISALIAFIRTLIFQIAAVMLLPLIFGIDGIWYSIVVAEVLAATLSLGFIVAKRNRYYY